MDLQHLEISKLTGMCWDKKLEQQFEESYLNRSKSYLQRVALFIGVLFFLFFFYDCVANSQLEKVFFLFFCRLICLVASIFIYCKPDFFLRSSPFLKITLYEFLLILVFFIIIINYENPHVLNQFYALNVIILGIFFLVPNLQTYRLVLAASTLIGFSVVTFAIFRIPLFEAISLFVYLTLTVLISSISSYSLGKYIRLDYFNKQYFKELSTRDSLTNAYNRLKFNQSLITEIELGRRYGNPFSLIMFDIDHFKLFNDKNGHIFGDEVLIGIAELVKASIREVDVFARWGGEEFVILLPQTTCKEASALAERLRKSIVKESMKKEMALSCSFGVTSFLAQDTEDLIMERVDRALYKAKEQGRNLVVTEYQLDEMLI